MQARTFRFNLSCGPDQSLKQTSWYVFHFVEVFNFFHHNSITGNFCLLFLFSLHERQQYSPRSNNASEPYVANLVHGRSTINNPMTINSFSWNILHTRSEISWRWGPKPSFTWVVRHHQEL
ncbi:hypothetical protein Hanom_Chr09g00770261 [Helianthus anomalus]